MRPKKLIPDLEREAIVMARRNGSTLKELRDTFHRGFETIREVLESAPSSEIAPLLSSSTALVAVGTNGHTTNKIDELAILNEALSSSVSNVLQDDLSRLIEATLRRLPHAHTLHIDLINRKAQAEVAQIVDLTVGGGK